MPSTPGSCKNNDRARIHPQKGVGFPLLAALSVLVDVLIVGSLPFFPYLAAFAAEPLLVLWLPVIALQVILLGPLSEELGWRGYAYLAVLVAHDATFGAHNLGV